MIVKVLNNKDKSANANIHESNSFRRELSQVGSDLVDLKQIFWEEIVQVRSAVDLEKNLILERIKLLSSE
jgi:hypothetical protein